MKTCRDCGVEKPLAEFHRHGSARDRRSPYCRPCACARSRRNREENLEARRAYDKERYAASPVVGHKAVLRRPRLTPEEKRVRNRDRARVYLSRPGPRAAHRDRAQRRAALRRGNGRGSEVVDSLVVLELADGVCGICGGDVDPFDFEVDHIVPVSKGGFHNYENVQPSHRRCNRAKSANLPVP